MKSPLCGRSLARRPEIGVVTRTSSVLTNAEEETREVRYGRNAQPLKITRPNASISLAKRLRTTTSMRLPTDMPPPFRSLIKIEYPSGYVAFANKQFCMKSHFELA